VWRGREGRFLIIITINYDKYSFPLNTDIVACNKDPLLNHSDLVCDNPLLVKKNGKTFNLSSDHVARINWTFVYLKLKRGE
jgi:hypothetical protein